MGLRAASVRHPNAVVMAPALTEAGQSQNFTLPPSSPSVSQNGGYVSHNNKHHTGNGIKKCSPYNGDLFDITSDYLNTPPVTEQQQQHQQQHKTHSSRKPASGFQQQPSAPQLNSGNTIMNTCPIPMGDQENDLTMGLQKTGMDPMETLLKDKSIISPDVEQLLNNFNAVTDSASDIGQNVDDLMQVIKNMEGNERGVQSTDGEIFPISFDRELFSEVDMMGICGEDDAATQSQLKETRAKEMLEELHKKQLKLERRSEFLLRRLRKIQTRGMGGHVSGEVAGLYEFIHRTLNRGKETPPSEREYPPSDFPIEIDLNPPTDQLLPPKAISQQTMVSLVQQLHASALQQSTSLSRQKNMVARYFGAGSSEQSSRVLSSSVLSVPPLPTAASDELEHVAGVLQSELAMVESQVDSDATASSSGAESCDEMQTYNNPHQQYLSIKRAAWRYANERAAVASRWTWLQAQISDLEYRIRQHNELHRQIRLCKGAVTLGDSCTTHTNTISTPASPSTVNGYRGQLPGATKSASTDDLLFNGAVSSSSGASASCARTRPLQKSTFRKRKLLQTTGLHTVSKKASRPSNIRCGCVPPVVPCALCTGRTDPTFPRDAPEQLTVPERIALLDPGYHPVLSFPDDISQSIHLEAIMKLPEWQQKILRCNMKSMKGISKTDRVDKLVTGLDSRSKKSEHRKKYNKLLKSSTTNVLSNKIKTKIGRGRKPFSRGISGMMRVSKKRHNNAKMAMAQLHALASESMDEEMEALGVPASVMMQSRAIGDSLSPSPLSHVQVLPYRRNRVDSYDIDNIVIPYSVAASTRVEKLQYKEILTPKWRVIDTDFPAKYDEKNNGIVRRASGDSEVEDMSEEIIGIRHDKCEHDERKKFLSYIKFPLTVGRPRANRRTDSRAESSGANTPDPMSPHNNNTMLMDGLDATASPLLLTSPPATPIMNQNDDSSTSQQLHHHTTSALRRRTVSQSRWVRDREETRSNTPEIIEPAMPPFDPRSFPLTDEKYEKMLRSMPEGHPLPNICFHKQISRDSDNTESATSPVFLDEIRPVESPISDSTESAIAEEDPNDPEWFDVERVRERSKR